MCQQTYYIAVQDHRIAGGECFRAPSFSQRAALWRGPALAIRALHNCPVPFPVWKLGHNVADVHEQPIGVVIETDSRSRVVIPGHRNERFVLQENEDGSLLLQPARVVTVAQLEYDGDAELQALLSRATDSSTVRRRRSRCPS